jgi:hypothetical protein
MNIFRAIIETLFGPDSHARYRYGDSLQDDLDAACLVAAEARAKEPARPFPERYDKYGRPQSILRWTKP